MFFKDRCSKCHQSFPSAKIFRAPNIKTDNGDIKMGGQMLCENCYKLWMEDNKGVV